MAANNGNTDAFFIAEVRRILRDQPVWYGESQPTDGTTGALTAGSKPFRLQRSPIILNSATVTAPTGTWVPVYNVTPTAGQVEIVSDTGEVIFPSAPVTGTLAVTYQAVKFSDQQILDALTDGLNMLWPDVWNPSVNTTTIAISPTIYEYALSAVATFGDPRVILRSVEFAPPSGIIRYIKTSLWRQVEDTVAPLLVFSRLPPVASTVRLSYVVPFTTLSQPPTQTMNLPVYFAVARLLLDQETMRSRSDDLPALTGEGAQQYGASINTSQYWMQQFSTQLVRMGMDTPTRMSVVGRAVERLGLSEFWKNSA